MKDQILLAKTIERRNKVHASGGHVVMVCDKPVEGVVSTLTGVPISSYADDHKKAFPLLGDIAPSTLSEEQSEPKKTFTHQYEIIKDCEKLPPYDTITIDTETTWTIREPFVQIWGFKSYQRTFHIEPHLL
jgi:hypothetical protein